MAELPTQPRAPQQYNNQKPEGSPQALWATGWLFVTKCRRLKADIVVVSSVTIPEAEEAAKAE